MSFDPTMLLEMGIGLGGVIAVAFVLGEVATLYITKGATSSIVGTATVAINAIVGITGVGVTASQAATVSEVSGVPTQLILPPPPTTQKT